MMKALVLRESLTPLQLSEVPVPQVSTGGLLVRVEACAVCRTDLHIVDGELTEPALPLIPGHEIVGIVEEVGMGVEGFSIGDRVGIPWLGWTCGHCSFCRKSLENLCDEAEFTGYTRNGGFAEYAVADARFCFPIPSFYSAVEAAPLLCAGLIGYRSWEKARTARRLGIYGFGAAAHIVAQIARFEGQEVYAFTKPGDKHGQDFALSMGACWAGDSTQPPPERLDAAILFAPVGSLVPLALKAVRKGGTVVCGGIHMSDIPGFSYELLWGERQLVSVANLTREDGLRFMKLAPQVPVKTTVETFPLERGNEALDRLRQGNIEGAAVLIP